MSNQSISSQSALKERQNTSIDRIKYVTSKECVRMCLKYGAQAFVCVCLCAQLAVRAPKQQLRAEMYSRSKLNQNKTFICAHPMPCAF